MAGHHVEAPEQVVTPGEELWVKIIDIDLDRRRISLSIKQAAEGGVVAAEYQDQFGDHAYDEQGNYIGPAVEGTDGEPGAEAANGEAGAAPVPDPEAGTPPADLEAAEVTGAVDTAETLETAAAAETPEPA